MDRGLEAEVEVLPPIFTARSSSAFYFWIRSMQQIEATTPGIPNVCKEIRYTAVPLHLIDGSRPIFL